MYAKQGRLGKRFFSRAEENRAQCQARVALDKGFA
jgi:hypothetical protein